MTWETVIGLEIHVQLATNSKIFSGASTRFGAQPNTQACAVDLAMPGVLPVLNKQAISHALTFGLAINAEIGLHSTFDRKNYFYPDLPKGYQITQFQHPIVGRGSVEVILEDGSHINVGITRAHLEEDAGKSVHENMPGLTGIDLNRAGTPLLEIVSEPDMHSAQQAVAYFKKMHALVKYLRICDGNLNEGSMRCDANVSIRKSGDTTLGVRTEIKNLNSFRFLEKAINYEIERQIELLESGQKIQQATLLYDADRNETRPMRSKETSEDYRYFPDPDLLPILITQADIDVLKKLTPELPDQRRLRFQETLALSEYDANWLTADPDIADYYEATVEQCNNTKLSANWVMGELSAVLNRQELPITSAPITAKQLGQIISKIADDTISGKIAKQIFDDITRQADPSVDVNEFIKQNGLTQMNDESQINDIVDQTILANPDQVQQFRDGKHKVMGYLVGQVMKQSQGKANPKQVSEMLTAKLKTQP
ncbi:MAG: Asp-tRNA(Asn)/Glu-tRNA(Gln) amidotransferase subunit GatB [Pseudomonadales bacterium]|nr:Asp-tRNA(Asn)/Glu-tRNA(Gln) amidotransferase subunit GatB [Pseudomonadales bacterium]